MDAVMSGDVGQVRVKRAGNRMACMTIATGYLGAKKPDPEGSGFCCLSMLRHL